MPRFLIAAVAVLLLIGGCQMTSANGPVPSKTEHFALQAGATTTRLFDCAETAIASFAKGNSSWLPVARKDVAAGILESTDFEPANIVGYRVRITAPADGGPVTIVLKAAGPYFIDLGAEQAMSELKSSITRCLGA